MKLPFISALIVLATANVQAQTDLLLDFTRTGGDIVEVGHSGVNGVQAQTIENIKLFINRIILYWNPLVILMSLFLATRYLIHLQS